MTRYIDPQWADRDQTQIRVRDLSQNTVIVVPADISDPVYRYITQGDPATGALPQEIADMSFIEIQAEATQAIDEYYDALNLEPLNVGGRPYAMDARSRENLRGYAVDAASFQKQGRAHEFAVMMSNGDLSRLQVDDVLMVHKEMANRHRTQAHQRWQAHQLVKAAHTVEAVEAALERVLATEFA